MISIQKALERKAKQHNKAKLFHLLKIKLTQEVQCKINRDRSFITTEKRNTMSYQKEHWIY